MASARRVMTPLLQARDLRVRRAGREVLAGVTLDIHPGELIALMGPSGAGKTTLLRVIAGLDRPDSGDFASRPAVGMVFQSHALFEHLSALDNVRLAPMHVHGVPPAAAAAAALRLLDHLGVGHRAGAWPRELSGGEAQRVAIARALAMDQPLLLLDEPTASLDPARRGELGTTLRGLTTEGRALLFTSHDDDFVREFATRVIILAGGVVVESGAPGAVLNAPTHPATQALLRAHRTPASNSL